MGSARVYSPAEICEMFGISKSTLFRWEQEGLLPPVRRALTGQREYTDEHVQAISTKQLTTQFERAAVLEDAAGLASIQEALSLSKFVYRGEIIGLYELAEYPKLSTNTIRQLLQVALDQYEPGDKVFCEVLQIVLKQCCPRD